MNSSAFFLLFCSTFSLSRNSKHQMKTRSNSTKNILLHRLLFDRFEILFSSISHGLNFTINKWTCKTFHTSIIFWVVCWRLISSFWHISAIRNHFFAKICWTDGMWHRKRPFFRYATKYFMKFLWMKWQIFERYSWWVIREFYL